MLIDWFTVFAQVVNFLILVLLLKRFLYGPLLRVMEERKLEIQQRLSQVEQDRTAAEEARARLAAESEAFERARDERLRVIDRECEDRRGQLTEELRLEIETLRDRWRKALTQEQDAFRQTLSDLAQRELIELAGRITLDLADARFEEQVTARFLQRLETSLAAPATAITALAGKPDLAPTVRSSFPLSDSAARKVEELLLRHLPTARIPTFSVHPEIGCGIELRLDHHKLAWTVTDYVARFQETVDGAIRAKADAAI